MVRGQNEDIGSCHEPQNVVSLAEKDESISETENSMSLVQFVLEGPPSDGRYADRKTLVGKNSGCLKKDVVAFLHSEVGDRNDQDLFSRQTEFGPHIAPDLVAP